MNYLYLWSKTSVGCNMMNMSKVGINMIKICYEILKDDSFSTNNVQLNFDKSKSNLIQNCSQNSWISLQFLNFYVILDHSVTCYG